MRQNLYAAAKKSVRTVIDGQVHILNVDVFAVSINPAPKLDPSTAPSFTAKQGQYLAFIYNYGKIHQARSIRLRVHPDNLPRLE